MTTFRILKTGDAPDCPEQFIVQRRVRLLWWTWWTTIPGACWSVEQAKGWAYEWAAFNRPAADVLEFVE